MILKELLKRTLATGPVYPLLWRFADGRRGVLVLTYHAIGPDQENFDAWVVLRARDFQAQMEFLQTHCTVLRIEDALSGQLTLATGKPAVIVTFDDGHSCLIDHLLPVIERLELPVTLYASTGHIETQRSYWFDRLANALQVCAPTKLDLRAHAAGLWMAGISTGPNHWNAIGPVFEALKRLSEAQREAAVEDAIGQLSHTPRREFRPLKPLTQTQLLRLAQSPLITIGAHSHCHSLLDQLTIEDAESTMRRSRDLLRQWTGHAVDHFAYPNGNFTPELEAAAARIGFRTAVTTQYGVWTASDRLHAIPRVGVGRFDGVHGMKWRIARARAANHRNPRPDSQVRELGA